MLMMFLDAFCFCLDWRRLLSLSLLRRRLASEYGPPMIPCLGGVGWRGGGRAQWCSNTHVLKECVSQCACRISVLFGKHNLLP